MSKADDIAIIEEALDRASQFFYHRDVMNAAVHVAKVRKSPITLMVEDAVDALSRVVQEMEPE